MEDYPRNLAEFEACFSTEAACREYLVRLRWPDGSRCPRCGGRKPRRLGDVVNTRSTCSKPGHLPTFAPAPPTFRLKTPEDAGRKTETTEVRRRQPQQSRPPDSRSPVLDQRGFPEGCPYSPRVKR